MIAGCSMDHGETNLEDITSFVQVRDDNKVDEDIQGTVHIPNYS